MPTTTCVNCQNEVSDEPTCEECGQSTSVEVAWCEFCRTAPAVTEEAPHACEECTRTFDYSMAAREDAQLAFAGL